MGERGLVHIYTGEGKGKTTAAVGLACRAAGAGKKVLIAQFLKGRPTGELASLDALGIRVLRTDVRKFVPCMSDDERKECAERQKDCFDLARGAAAEVDMLILDEVIGAVAYDMIGLDELLAFVAARPDRMELVMTGRYAPERLVEAADYVSEIVCVKHPFARGIGAREGIEY